LIGAEQQFRTAETAPVRMDLARINAATTGRARHD
jgi:hypothetical protein